MWSIWYGLDYSNPEDRGSASVNFLDAQRDEEGFVGHHVVENLGDVENLRTDFDVNQFSQLFFMNHQDSDVTVDSLVSTVYISEFSKRQFAFLHKISAF